MNPTSEDLIELGYLKPGDALASAPKRERKLFLTESDLEYAERHDLTRQEMKDFKEEMMIEEEILPGFASAIKIIALFKPIEKISSTFSILADLFSHFK